MMFQSDFHRKKNFANPNLFNNSTATEKTAPAEQPTPASGRPDSKEENKEPEEVRTEHLFKHPLQNTWTLWYLENDRSKSWEDMQNEITSFDTVEDFWSLYNHIKPPSDIKLGSDYSLFKKGIRPMWEDAGNKQGGRWVITLNKSSKADLDNLWLDVLLCLIGEAFDHSDEVCGAVVNIRGKNNKISIWTANGNNEEAALEIGNKLREALRLGRQNLQYQLHKDTMVKQGSSVKSIYTL
ncbi:eukaryotic translation initiation factor 4E1 isoform X1 [Anastrepha ludens]|uniref:eukaryotic translation initiation factor 4E1 isoform X1 n=1 Tax=Anastrepha ludens TaxID=28586 RepID=UPI0023B0B4EB|nr:eukaryotic translation initiation factor 4E1 isoform X1 [Anastrepha ludens]